MKAYAFLLLLVVSSLAVAQEETSRTLTTEALFKQYDKNGDARISKQEAGEAKFFDKADANDNGFVTVREATLFVQRAKKRAATPSTSKPVFPADPKTAAAKQQILKSIENVTQQKKRPPNVVLIFSDDLGYADISSYGSKVIPTPHIDALAKTGVKFTNAYVTAASCSPSRAGLMSGRYQQRFGFEFNTAGGGITHRLHRGLDPAAITMADVLQKAGYATGMFGKWHLGTQPQFHPQVRGFDQFYGFLAGAHTFFPATTKEPFHSTIMRDNTPLTEPEYLTDAIAREAAQFIDAHADSPFFVYVPFNAVHTPIEATKKYQDRFPNIKDPTRRDYYAMTSAMDDAVGTIVEAIERNQLTDNTLLIFMNDNGGPTYTGVQSNGPLRMGKLFLFEGGIRVPMMIRWPGVISGNQVISGTTSSLDLFPTICAAAGITLPKEIPLDGVDLISFVTGKNSASPHESLFWSNGPNKAVRHQHWKLIISGKSKWLYNLEDDMGEQKNLVESHPEKLQELETLLKNWQKQMSPPAWPSKPQRKKVIIDGGVYELNI